MRVPDPDIRLAAKALVADYGVAGALAKADAMIDGLLASRGGHVEDGLDAWRRMRACVEAMAAGPSQG